MNGLDDKGIKYNKKMIYIVIVIISTTFMLFLIQKNKNEVEDIKYNIEEIKKEIGKKEENIIRYRDELGIKTESEVETLRSDYQKLNESLDDIEKELSNIKDKYKEIESSNELLTSKRARINEDIEKVNKGMETMLLHPPEHHISELGILGLFLAQGITTIDAGIVASTDLEEEPGIVTVALVGDTNIKYETALLQKEDYGKLEPEVDNIVQTVHKALQFIVKEFNDIWESNVFVVLYVTGPTGEDMVVYLTNGDDRLYDHINGINIKAE